MDENGQTAEIFPLNAAVTEFGRTRGDHTFPQTDMISRSRMLAFSSAAKTSSSKTPPAAMGLS